MRHQDVLPPFEGEWAAEFVFPEDPPGRISGQVSFERIGEARLLQMRSTPKEAGPPASISVIGRDDHSGGWSMLYWDERGVSRIYEMGWEDGTWTLICHTSEFFQRFQGTLSSDGNVITGAWWTSNDGKAWDKDFELTYRRVALR